MKNLAGHFHRGEQKESTPNFVRVYVPLNIYQYSAGETCTLILAADDLVDFPAGIINSESVAQASLSVLSVFT